MSLLFTGGSDLLMQRGIRGSYANPHSTIAVRDIPTNVKQIMRLTRFYFMQDSLLGAIVDKMSEYPITSLIIDEKDGISDKDREKWEYILEVSLNLRSVMKNINVDKYVYGNSFHYLYFPFVRYCVDAAGNHFPIQSVRNLRATPDVDRYGRFTLTVFGTVAKDGYRREHRFRVVDKRSRARAGLNLTRLNPLRMDLAYNPMSGQQEWYWKPSHQFRDAILEGHRPILETTEMKILEASWREDRVKLNRDRLWVAQADQMPGLWEGWGVPPLFRVLEDVYYYKILRRANEALAQEHVTPMRIISPSGTGDISPQRTMNLTNWQGQFRRELQRFKLDPNHIVISPTPVNVEQMGGNARVMMVATEMEAAARVIAAGIGCPIEMIWGGLNWSGASVSLRVLENHFLNDRENSKRLLSFLVPKISQYFRLPRVNVDLADFKMADDIQAQQNAINMMLQGFLSRESVLNHMDYDSNVEFRRLSEEHVKINKITMQDNIAAAHMNSQIQLIESKAQILMQYELQLVQEAAKARFDRTKIENIARYAAQLREQGLVTPLEFQHTSTMLQRMNPTVRGAILNNWMSSMPMVAKLLMESVEQGVNDLDAGNMANPGLLPAGPGAEGAGAAEGQDMAPGAGGPFAEGFSDMGGQPGGPGDMQAEDGGADMRPLPEQNPPRRENSPI